MFGRITLVSMLGSVVLAFAPVSFTQNVTTWHYDNLRTGWQQNETALTTSTVGPSTFGKIMQYNVQGDVYAQPLALRNVSGMTGCSGSCNVVFVVTQQDMLYAFNADYVSSVGAYPTPLWSLDLAAEADGGTYINCYSQMISPCVQGVIWPNLGVTSTPVVDTATDRLYVVSMVYFTPDGDREYYIHAVNYLTGKELVAPNNPYQITATYSGPLPTGIQECETYPTNGEITFDASIHYQRAALLLLNGEVYLAFAPSGNEVANGWLLAYSYGANGFQRDDKFVTTPYGSGGGIWMDGAGIATDGNYLYLSVANGTFDVAGVQNPNVDYGDSLLKMNPYQHLVSTLSVNQYFTPSDVFTFVGGSGNGTGRCPNDEDLGSGGVMLFPDLFYSNEWLMVTADKESKLYLLDTDDLTGYNSGGDQIVEEFQSPTPVETLQGYWGSPAYWEWTNGSTRNRAIYYSVDSTSQRGTGNNAPQPLTMYTVQSTAPPVSQSPYTTSTAFCGHGGQPSVSSATNGAYNGLAGTGIVWAYEDQNPDNPFDCNGTPVGRAALHAYDASNVHNAELYNSRSLTSVNYPVKFATPVVFNGKVYMGTRTIPTDGTHQQTEVDVFGLCGQSGQPTCFAN